MKRDVYFEYAKESNLGAVSVYLLMLVGAQTAQIGRSLPMQAMNNITAECPDMLGARQKTLPPIDRESIH